MPDIEEYPEASQVRVQMPPSPFSPEDRWFMKRLGGVPVQWADRATPLHRPTQPRAEVPSLDLDTDGPGVHMVGPWP